MNLKHLLSFLFVLFLLSRSEDLFASSDLTPEIWAQQTVSPSLQLPHAIKSQVDRSIGSPLTASLPSTGLSISLSAPILTDGEQFDALSTQPVEGLEDVEELASEFDENEDPLSLVDPETLEEARILTEEEAIPPDDEGATVQVTELQFDFPVVENQKVQYYIDYFTGPGRKVFTRWLERSTRYLPYMQEVFTAQGLPRDLAYLSIVESGLNPKAYSWAHASGPWQFISSTGKMFGLDSDYWWDERRDFEKSTQAAALYLKELYSLFNGDWYLAVASYNAGPGTVARAIERGGNTDFWVLAHTDYLPEETKNYIPKLLAVLLIAKQPIKYNFTDTPYLEPVACDKVMLEGTNDLAVIARLSGKSYDEIKTLNPELKRWCTPPKLESYQINLPAGTKESFLAAYAELPASERINYQTHKLAKGETLKSLARQSGVSIDEILRVNSLTSTKSVKAGRHIVIPLRPGVDAIARADLIDDPVAISVAKAKKYKVKKGDTLSGIAQRHGVSLSQLKSWNRLKEKSRLQIGQVIIIGQGKKSSASVTAKTKKSSKKEKISDKSSSAGNKIVYTVKKGDTVYKIARQYAVNPDQVLNWNGLGSEHTLQPGQNLTLRIQGRKGG